MHWQELFTEPVALIGAALLVLSWLLIRQRPRGSACVLTVTLTILYFMATTPLGANLAIGALESTAAPDPACGTLNKNSVIVVLAGGMSGRPKSAEEFSRLQEPSLRRTFEGVRLAQRITGSRLWLVGGTGGDVREADLMGALAKALGFPADRLILGRESRTTFESAREIVGMMHAASEVNSMYLVTSAFHMPRAHAVFRHQGLEVCAYPVDRSWVEPKLEGMFIPQISALRKTTVAFHEVVGYVWYWLTDRL
jgi:uncharacterized SAM-binding protein YcdF (DUF218 family)